MAKHAQTEPAAASQPTAAPADEPSLARKAASRATDQAFLKIRKPIARWIARKIPDPLKNWAKTWADTLPYISIAIATLTPGEGKLAEHLDAFQQDLFDAIEEELKNPSASTGTGDFDADTTAHLNTIVSIMQAVDDLAVADRRNFEEWYFDTPEHQVGFNRLVTGADKGKIKSMAIRPKPELERMIKHLKIAPKINMLDLQTTISQDAVLTGQVANFLARISAGGQDRTREFWTAVERRKMQVVAELKSLMKMTDKDILDFLHMPSTTIQKRLKDASARVEKALGLETKPTGKAETGAVKWSGDFLAKAKKAAGIK